MFSKEYYLNRVNQLKTEGLSAAEARAIVDIEERNEEIAYISYPGIIKDPLKVAQEENANGW